MKVYLVAGEASGDLLGSRLMRALKHQTNNDIAFYGVGGETMQSEGLNSLFDIKDLSVMGFMEVIPSIPNKCIRKRWPKAKDISFITLSEGK